MPFHPAPALPRSLADAFNVARRSYELTRGPDAGREVHFVDEGDRAAPAVVFLHGNPTWSFLWRKVIDRLGEYRRVAPDLLGFGLSSRLPKLSDHTLARHADAMAELLDQLALPRFVLVGQDWGGPIATSIGARLPDRVAGLVLANTSVLVPRKAPDGAFFRLARLPYVGEALFRGLGVPQRLMWAVQGDRNSIRGPVARAYRWPLRRLSDRVGPLALARMVPDSPAHPSIDELRRGEQWATGFDGPKAFVWGQRDPILGRALSSHERAFPDAPVTLTDAGHFLQEEVPDALAAAVRDVWRRADDREDDRANRERNPDRSGPEPRAPEVQETRATREARSR